MSFKPSRLLGLVSAALGALYLHEIFRFHHPGMSPHDDVWRFFCGYFFFGGEGVFVSMSAPSLVLIFPLILIVSGTFILAGLRAGRWWALFAAWSVWVVGFSAVSAALVTTRAMPGPAWRAGAILPIVLSVVSFAVFGRRPRA